MDVQSKPIKTEEAPVMEEQMGTDVCLEAPAKAKKGIREVLQPTIGDSSDSSDSESSSEEESSSEDDVEAAMRGVGRMIVDFVGDVRDEIQRQELEESETSSSESDSETDSGSETESDGEPVPKT